MFYFIILQIVFNHFYNQNKLFIKKEIVLYTNFVNQVGYLTKLSLY